jgi:HEAT repeat protein
VRNCPIIFQNRAFLLLTMTGMFRTLIFSHIIVFAAGFTAGKMIDGDELSLYREAHESNFTRFRRRAAEIALGSVVLGTVIVVARMASRKSSINN